MLGFISDEDACALIKNCRAFIHPSLYEGFGIPPLEALALGAEVIASNATALPEVLGESVHYIEPLKGDINFELLLKKLVSSSDDILCKYSWNTSAEELYHIMRE